jgi:hypothetical protein
MAQDAQIVMRVPQEMADRLKECAATLSREYGIPVSVAAAARRFIAEGLERAGYPAAGAAPAPSSPKVASKASPKKAAAAKAKR